jgi:hypothetical protein
MHGYSAAILTSSILPFARPVCAAEQESFVSTQEPRSVRIDVWSDYN